jgi:hypothetical protein
MPLRFRLWETTEVKHWRSERKTSGSDTLNVIPKYATFKNVNSQEHDIGTWVMFLR